MSPTRYGGAGKSLWPLYAVRLYRQGDQLVFPIYKAVAAAIGCAAGDLALVRVHLPFITFRIANPPTAMPVEHFDREKLPPDYKGLLEEIARILA